MRKLIVVSSVCLVVCAIGAGVLINRTASACPGPSAQDAKQSPGTAASSEAHEEPSCSLDPAVRAHAESEMLAFNKAHLQQLNVTITAVYVGDKGKLERVLSAIIEREASCCAHLVITKTEVADGYAVTVKGTKSAVEELVSILEAAKF